MGSGAGQPIHQDVTGHSHKAGTPTMGGVAIVTAALAGYTVAHLRSGVIFTYSGLLVMAAIAGAGLVGLIDDYIKVKSERNLGLSKRAKMVGLLTVAIGFAVLAVNQTPVHTTISFTRFNVPGIELGSKVRVRNVARGPPRNRVVGGALRNVIERSGNDCAGWNADQ